MKIWSVAPLLTSPICIVLNISNQDPSIRIYTIRSYISRSIIADHDVIARSKFTIVPESDFDTTSWVYFDSSAVKIVFLVDLPKVIVKVRFSLPV